ncbi:cadmium resistance transporter [Lentilactobacillus otakiensis]|uniref:cadmium resistance transporter n=1 Tax=Lentilactobacillus otakiensis TaxID=481720 RepID=UPI003D177588
MIATIITSIISFIGTNIDDTFVLAVWFSQTDSHFQKKDVVIGQFVGFEFLVLISVFAAYGLGFLPTDKVGWLGIIPIIVGIQKWFQYRRKVVTDSEETAVKKVIHHDQKFRINKKASPLTRIIRTQMLSVALVTISNGAGNLTVYIPLFTEYTIGELILTVVVFTIMTGVWCLIGYTIASLPFIKEKLEHYKEIIIPIVFVSIGFYVLWESGII